MTVHTLLTAFDDSTTLPEGMTFGPRADLLTVEAIEDYGTDTMGAASSYDPRLYGSYAAEIECTSTEDGILTWEFDLDYTANYQYSVWARLGIGFMFRLDGIAWDYSTASGTGWAVYSGSLAAGHHVLSWRTNNPNQHSTGSVGLSLALIYGDDPPPADPPGVVSFESGLPAGAQSGTSDEDNSLILQGGYSGLPPMGTPPADGGNTALALVCFSEGVSAYQSFPLTWDEDGFLNFEYAVAGYPDAFFTVSIDGVVKFTANPLKNWSVGSVAVTAGTRTVEARYTAGAPSGDPLGNFEGALLDNFKVGSTAEGDTDGGGTGGGGNTGGGGTGGPNTNPLTLLKAFDNTAVLPNGMTTGPSEGFTTVMPIADFGTDNPDNSAGTYDHRVFGDYVMALACSASENGIVTWEFDLAKNAGYQYGMWPMLGVGYIFKVDGVIREQVNGPDDGWTVHKGTLPAGHHIISWEVYNPTARTGGQVGLSLVLLYDNGTTTGGGGGGNSSYKKGDWTRHLGGLYICRVDGASTEPGPGDSTDWWEAVARPVVRNSLDVRVGEATPFNAGETGIWYKLDGSGAVIDTVYVDGA